MKTTLIHRSLLAFAAITTLLAASSAEAGLFRAYLSVNGNDTNPCTLQLPCRLLPTALAVANDGGEVWMLDSANYNTGVVTINKSITILAVPGALGSVIANGADAISINTAGAKVTLRNLVILNLAGTVNTGINFTNGSALTVEGCEMYGLLTGISSMAPSGIVTIKDSTIRDNTANGVFLAGGGTVMTKLDRVSLINNNTGLSAGSGASVTISNSAISGSAVGIAVGPSGGSTAQATVSATDLSGNGTGISLAFGGSSAGDTALVVLNNTTITQNGAGVSYGGLGTKTVFSRGNNTLKFNTNDFAGGAAMTALAAQ